MSFEHTSIDIKDFSTKIAIVFVLHLVLTVIFQMYASIYPGTELRIAAFIPIVFGILWGLPAAIGVFGANIVSDMFQGIPLNYSIVGSIFNGLICIFAYRCFYALKKSGSNDYICNGSGMIAYILTVLISDIMLSTSLALLLSDCYGTSIIDNFCVTFFNNIAMATLIGAPVLMFVVKKMERRCSPVKERTGRWRYVAFSILALPILLDIFKDTLDHNAIVAMLSVNMIAIIFFIFVCPINVVEYRPDEFNSLKYQSFVYILLLSIIATGTILVALFLFLYFTTSHPVSLWKDAFRLSAVVMYIMMFTTAVTEIIIERKVTRPVFDIAKNIRNDDDCHKNELEVLSNRLDFVADSKSSIGGNSFVLYIGLTDRYGKMSVPISDARNIIDSICLEFVEGYIQSNSAVGGYKGNDAEVTENVLVYTIFGASDEQINGIAKKSMVALNQETIMVEKNKIARWYIHNDD